MVPVIDPAVVRTFHALLFQWTLYLSLGIACLLVGRWLLMVLGEHNPEPALSLADIRHPWLGLRRFLFHRVGDTPKERLVLWWGLGLLWILDAVLQAQPAIPNNGFVQDVLAPAVAGQPGWFIPILGWNIQFWTDYPIGADVFAVLIEMGIGICLIVGMDRFAGRLALWTSIVWGMGIWIFGEGMGGILTGSATWLAGSPGSVVFYIWGAVFLLLPEMWWESGRIARIARQGIGLFWLLAALAQAWPGARYWSGSSLYSLFFASANMPQPTVLASPMYAMAAAAQIHPFFWNFVFVTVMVVLGLAYLSNQINRWTVGLTMLWLFFTWWMGQDFGVMGGVGTDPNSAPVLALLTVSVWRMRWKRVGLATDDSAGDSLGDAHTFFTSAR